MNVCANCSNLVDRTAKYLNCDKCSAKLHLSCIGFTNEDLPKITRSKTNGASFVCKNCRNSTSNTKSLEDLFNLMLEFKTKLENVEQRLANIETSIPMNIDNNSENFEVLVSEAMERIERSKNIIISGINENESDIFENSIQVVKAICPTLENNIVHVQRIGKVLNNRPRLVKILFNNKQAAVNILKNKTKLLSTKFKNLRIHGDETKLQRDYLNKLRQKLQERSNAGETNLTIKYIKGKPTILSTSDRTETESASKNYPQTSTA